METVSEEAGVMRLRAQEGGLREQGGIQKNCEVEGRKSNKFILNRVFLVNLRPGYQLRVRNQYEMN